ncbi:MAG: ATP-binding protein [Sedimenticola sp.]|nr:ATP-binding protein [Sedimenticola sp.]
MQYEIDLMGITDNRNSRSVALGVLFVLLLSITVLFGWHFQAIPLIQLHPDFSPMPYNTALCFLLSASGLLLLLLDKGKSAFIIGMVTLLLASATLTEHIFSIDLAIDQLLINEWPSTLTSQPNRMAVNTASGFMLYGLALIVSSLRQVASNRWCSLLISILTPAVLGLGLVALFTYASMQQGLSLAHMTPPTAIGFILLGAAHFTLSRTSAAIQEHAIDTRYNLPIVVVLLILVISIWDMLVAYETNQAQHEMEINLRLSRETTEALFSTESEALQRMAMRWEIRNGTPLNEWQADAAEYVKNVAGLNAIGWVDNKGILQRLSPLSTQQALLGHNFSQNETAASSMRLARQADQPYVTDPVPLFNQGSHILVFIPLVISTGDDGFIVGIFEIRSLLSPLYNTAKATGYHLQVKDQSQILMETDETYLKGDIQWRQSSELNLGNLKWTVHTVPLPKLFSSTHTALPSIILFGGVMMVFLLAVALHFVQLTRQKQETLSREVEERKRNQSALAAAREQLQLILDSAQEGIYGVDLNGLTTFANPAACKMTGLTFAEMQGQNQHELIHHTRSDGSPYPRSDCFIYDALTSGKTHHIEDELFWRKNGSSFPVSYTSTPIRDAKDQIKGAVVTFQDITERKAAENEIRRYTRDLEQSNQELDKFAYIASHDLKSPLRGIDQLASWITEDLGEQLNDETAEHLRLMRSRLNRMERLLDDLLTYSRIGRKAFVIKPVDVREMIEGLWSLHSVPEHFELKLTGEYPLFNTLETPLEQVFRNLISNSIKHFTGVKGIIEITASAQPSGYTFSIRDNGPGIEPKHQERVFGMFQTLRSRDDVEGSGMGLAIVKKIVENYGGTIRLESDGKHGTCFIFTWPDESTLRRLLDDHQ